jgi:hypothetical protein
MKKIRSLALASLFVTLSFGASASGIKNVTEMDLTGAQSCLVFHAESGYPNFGIICDGKEIWLTGAPSRKVLGEKSFKEFKKAYKNIMTEKCSAAGLTSFHEIDDANFWGLFCNI